MKKVISLAFTILAMMVCYSQSAQVYYKRGIDKLEQRDVKRDYKQAILEFDKSIELKPSYVEAYMKRAKAKEELKDFQGAVLDYSKVIEINPGFIPAYRNRGQLKSRLFDAS